MIKCSVKKISNNPNTFTNKLEDVGFILKTPAKGESMIFFDKKNKAPIIGSSEVLDLFEDSKKVVLVETLNSVYQVTLED